MRSQKQVFTICPCWNSSLKLLVAINCIQSIQLFLVCLKTDSGRECSYSMHCAKIKNRDVNFFKYLQNPILDNFYHGFSEKKIKHRLVSGL